MDVRLSNPSIVEKYDFYMRGEKPRLVLVGWDYASGTTYRLQIWHRGVRRCDSTDVPKFNHCRKIGKRPRNAPKPVGGSEDSNLKLAHGHFEASQLFFATFSFGKDTPFTQPPKRRCGNGLHLTTLNKV
jgi:hypothetical protein